MQIVFKGNISDDETRTVTEWLEMHKPASPQHLKIDGEEYVLLVVNGDEETVSYRVSKPETINIPQY